jgi:hypothetical protein
MQPIDAGARAIGVVAVIGSVLGESWGLIGILLLIERTAVMPDRIATKRADLARRRARFQRDRLVAELETIGGQDGLCSRSDQPGRSGRERRRSEA